MDWKPQTGWAIKYPGGEIDIKTIRANNFNWHWFISSRMDEDESYEETENRLEHAGYRCVQIEIREVE